MVTRVSNSIRPCVLEAGGWVENGKRDHGNHSLCIQRMRIYLYACAYIYIHVYIYIYR